MNILLVDDHPLILTTYNNIFKDSFNDVNIDTAHNCREAYEKIYKNENNTVFYDLVILDYNISPYKDIANGAALIKIIRNRSNVTKVILITAHQEVLLIYEILKKYMPDGLAVKNDITAFNLPEIALNILSGANYQSETVKECVQKVLKKNILMEDYNRQILLYLSKGYKVKDLKDVIMLTTSTIQRRVVNMKTVFEVSDDNSLVRIAMQEGYI